MNLDFTKFFKKYEGMVAQVDSVFEHVKKNYPDCVKCEVKCSDCCHALFDLSLIEAMYINHHFNQMFEGQTRSKILEKADSADRKIHVIKRRAFKKSQSGTEDEIFKDIAKEKVRCPLLNDNDQCDMYEYRPITCRLYGIPTSIGDRAHTCGLSGFNKGKSYPTVKLDKIYNNLYQISLELISSLKTKYFKMADVLVPLSMALLTSYNEEYLGLKDDKNEKEGN
ncbi:Zinc- or iron-chelating domain-containing protein [Candidatus Magnetomoraceae bacterium gMMP-15]